MSTSVQNLQLRDEKLAYVRKELGVIDDVIAINAGSWGPMCKAALDKLKQVYDDDYVARVSAPDGYYQGHYTTDLENDRVEVGRFLNCSSSEVGLCESSTSAMNIFLWGVDYEPGDEIVAGSLENPAAGVPLWVVTKRRKLKLTFADQGNGEKDATKAIQEAISPKTKLILISHVSFANGNRIDLKSISRIAHEKGILVLVDGIQAVGTGKVDVKETEVDGYAMARHKFLVGPDGAGALYVKKEVQDQVNPTFTGVFSDAGHGMTGKLDVMKTAQKYEVSTRPIPVFVAGTACLKWLDGKVGWHYIYETTKRNRNLLWSLLNEVKGVTMISLPDQESGLVTFAINGVEPLDVVNRFKKARIACRVIIVTKPNGIRVSVGFWNRRSDLEAIAREAKAIASGV